MSADLETLLSRAEALDKAATPGPWGWRGYGARQNGDEFVLVSVSEVDSLPLDSRGDFKDEYPQYIVQTDGGVYGPRGNDREFIAEARTLLPQMARMLRQVQATAPCDADCEEARGHETHYGSPHFDPAFFRAHEYEPPAWLRAALTPDADGDGGR